MKAEQKRCPYCSRAFRPDRRARVQTCCGRAARQRARKRQNLRHWRTLHPGHVERYQAKERAWAKAYPNYWRYRRKHPEYVARDGQRRAVALKRTRHSANETGFLRWVSAIEECLRSTVAVVCSAKGPRRAFGAQCSLE
jgi:hypothetical protein